MMSWKHHKNFIGAALALSMVAILGASPAVGGPVKPIRFDRLSLEEGLSQSTIVCLFQDSRGFVWIGTEDGLNRFDGLSFRIYKHDATDPGSLPANFVFAIDEDPDGNLWVATDGGGVAILDRETDRFRRLEGLPGEHIRALRVFDGAVWIGTRDSGLVRFDLEAKSMARFVHEEGKPTSLSDDRIFVIHADGNGALWIGTDAGLNRFDRASRDFKRFTHEPGNPASLPHGRVRSIAEDDAGALWIATNGGGVSRLDVATGGFKSFRHDPKDPTSLAHDRVRAVLTDSDGRLWVDTARGLDLLDSSHGEFVHYANDRTDPHSLADPDVMSLAQDRGGVLWVGTRMGGLHKWNPLSWQFGHVAPDPDDPNGLAGDKVTGISEDRAGRLWVSLFGVGVQVINRKTGETTRYRHNPEDPTSLSSDRVTALFHDRQGVLWVSTVDGGLNRFDADSGTFKRFRHDPSRQDSLGADGTMAVFEDRSGRLWVGTYGGGLNRFEPATETFTRFRHDPEDPKSLGSDRVTVVGEGFEGELWIGTDGGGLNRYDRRTRTFEHFTHDASNISSIGSDTVYSLYMSPKGVLWIGTRNGLSRLDAETGSFTTVTTRDGLPNDVIYGIRPDLSGRLWLSTNHGLSCYDPGSGETRNFSARHGLQHNEFNFGASHHSLTGELFFGGINGFNAFFPDRLAFNRHAPDVVLTAIRKDYRPVDRPPDAIDSLELGPWDQAVTFEFAALDYTAPEHSRFAFMLEGFNDDWVELTHARHVTYTSLAAGDYTFRLKAANSDGVWNEEGLTLPLTVSPPPWKTSWAFGAYSLMLAGSIVGFVQVQRRKVEREAEYNRILEQQIQERTRELTDRKLELERVNRKLAKASITDTLTGLANRRFLMDYIEKEAALVRRRYREFDDGTLTHDSLDLAFMMVDLDNFKTINDAAGHAAGDSVLRQLRDILDDACRSSDIAIRWGGDEFLIVARESNQDKLQSLAERIRSRIAEHLFEIGSGRVVKTTCSIGYACYPFMRSRMEALSWEQVISVADRALYVAKNSGRNAWVGFHSTETTGPDGLLATLTQDPAVLTENGTIEVRTSFTSDDKLVWSQEN